MKRVAEDRRITPGAADASLVFVQDLEKRFEGGQKVCKSAYVRRGLSVATAERHDRKMECPRIRLWKVDQPPVLRETNAHSEPACTTRAR